MANHDPVVQIKPDADDIAKAERLIISRSRYVSSYTCWFCKGQIPTGDVAYLVKRLTPPSFYEYVHEKCWIGKMVAFKINED